MYESWIIDARGQEIDFQILHWRKTGYAAAPHKSGWQRSRVFGRSFQFTRERDRRGAWRYAQAMKGDAKTKVTQMNGIKLSANYLFHEGYGDSHIANQRPQLK